MTTPSDTFQNALMLHRRGQLVQAQLLYRQILAIDGSHFDSLHLLGLACIQSGEVRHGIDYIRRALAVRTDVSEAYYNLGNALLTIGLPDEALANFNTALKLKPDDAQCHFEAGNALKDLKQVSDAIASYDEAIRLNPRYAEAHSNRGNALRELLRLEEALACHDMAIALWPGYAEAHYNRGNVLADLKRPAEAVASFDAALAIRPDYAEAQHNKGHLLLGCGQFTEGFECYKSRWQSPTFGRAPLQTTIPRWDGSTGQGHLLLWAEQGIGDEILHASLLSLIPDDGLRVTLTADKRLHPIYQRSFPHISIIDSETLKEPVNDGFTAQAPIGDLGGLLRLDAARIAERRSPFLHASAERRQALRTGSPFLAAAPVCGISWRSSNKRIGEQKSLHLLDLAPLLAIPGLSFVNLQYGEVGAEIAEARAVLGTEVHQVEGLDVFHDIDGLLALVDACDIVVTTSNITAHLAGALAKTAVVLVPTGKGCLWYWQGGLNNLWYPSLKRVAQESPGDWAGAIAEAAGWVKESI